MSATFTRLTPNPVSTGHGDECGDRYLLQQTYRTFFAIFLATGCRTGIGAWTSTTVGHLAVGACVHSGTRMT